MMPESRTTGTTGMSARKRRGSTGCRNLAVRSSNPSAIVRTYDLAAAGSSRHRQRHAAAQNGFRLGTRRSVRVVEHERREQARAARRCPDGAHQDADRGGVRFRMDRQHRDAAEAARARRAPRPSPSARQISVSVPRGREQRGARNRPIAASASALATWAQRGAPHRARHVPRRIVERRIYQHVVDARTIPCRRERAALRRDVQRGDLHPIGKPVARGILARELRQRRVDLDQRTSRPGTRCASASPAAPTPAPRSTA